MASSLLLADLPFDFGSLQSQPPAPGFQDRVANGNHVLDASFILYLYYNLPFSKLT